MLSGALRSEMTKDWISKKSNQQVQRKDRTVGDLQLHLRHVISPIPRRRHGLPERAVFESKQPMIYKHYSSPAGTRSAC